LWPCFLTAVVVEQGGISMLMKLKDGKSKVLTLSYDDGVVQDIRFVEILDRHGLKCTFNINTGLYEPENTQRKRFRGNLKLSEAQALYSGSHHEVAMHSLTHPFLETLSQTQVLTEILENRKNIESQYGHLARGMAFPNGTYNKKVLDIMSTCGVCYSRTVKSTWKFDFPENWLTLHPTCHHNDSRLMVLAEKFVEENPRFVANNWMFYVWGHTYEFDDQNNWQVIEDFASYTGRREDIWYATNIEIYDYVQAFNAIQTSIDESIVHNPTALDIWFHLNGEIHCIHPGQTLFF